MSACARPPAAAHRAVGGPHPARVEAAAAVDLGRADELERDAAALDRVEDLGLGVDADRLGGDHLRAHHRRRNVVGATSTAAASIRSEVGDEELAGELPCSRSQRRRDADDEDVAGPAAAGERPRDLLVDGRASRLRSIEPCCGGCVGSSASAR